MGRKDILDPDSEKSSSEEWGHSQGMLKGSEIGVR